MRSLSNIAETSDHRFDYLEEAGTRGYSYSLDVGWTGCETYASTSGPFALELRQTLFRAYGSERSTPSYLINMKGRSYRVRRTEIPMDEEALNSANKETRSLLQEPLLTCWRFHRHSFTQRDLRHYYDALHLQHHTRLSPVT